MSSMKDKVIIVTGASNGIGAATAAHFAAQGAKVARLDIRDALSSSTDGSIDIKCDVSKETDVQAAVKQVVDKFGTIDVLCNVAGITDKFEPVGTTSNDLLARVMGINFYGPWNLTKAVIPHFLSKPGEASGEGMYSQLPYKGSIVNVCSVASLRGAAAGAAYTCSKHALLGLTRNTAYMYHREGIRTNAVMPGGTATNIVANSDNGDFDPMGYKMQKMATSAMPAVAMPHDVAAAVVFLAGAQSVNGAELSVDKGWLAA